MEKRMLLGIQVYGLRDLLEQTPEQLKHVMEQVREIGYDGVELAGLYGLDPLFVRQTLDEIGLIPISAHVPFNEMIEDLDKVISDYSKIGVKYLVMPYMAEEYRPVNVDGFKAFLPLLNQVGQKIHEAGMTFLYHNHDFEFVKLPDGRYGYDAMFEAIPEEHLKPELDTCWCDVATGSSAEFIRKYTDRMPIVHYKDYIKQGEVKNMYKLIGIDSSEDDKDTGYFGYRPVGFGQVTWEPVMKATLDAHADWVVVEQDEHYEMNPLEAAEKSFKYLKLLGM